MKERGSVILAIILLIIPLALFGYFILQKYLPGGDYNPLVSDTPKQDMAAKSVQNVYTPSPTTNPNPDFPPLYPEIKWESPKEELLLFNTSDGDVLELSSTIYRSSETVNNPSKILEYYNKTLTNDDWILEGNAEGPNGESVIYKKNAIYFSVDVLISESFEPDNTTYKVILAISK